jgi:hypothetical protein
LNWCCKQLQLDLHGFAQLEVERAERFVEQQHIRIQHHAAGNRDALLLATGKLVDFAIGDIRQRDALENVMHLGADDVVWKPRSANRRRCSHRRSSSGTRPDAGTPS